MPVPSLGIESTFWRQQVFQYGCQLTENPPSTDNDKGLATTNFVVNFINPSTVVEVNFGSIPAFEKTFTITDVSILNTHYINARIEPVASSDKSKDDVEMETFYILSTANNGSISILVRSLHGRVIGKYKLRYFVNKN